MIKTDITKLEPKKNIIIKGAQVHNLKNLDVAIPRNKLVVITGLSGSGKSSLAFMFPKELFYYFWPVLG